MTNWPDAAIDIRQAFIECRGVAIIETGDLVQVITDRADAWSRLADLVRQHPGFRLTRAASTQAIYLVHPEAMKPMQAAGVGSAAPTTRDSRKLEPEQVSLW